MKNIIYYLIAILLVYTSCGDDEKEDKDVDERMVDLGLPSGVKWASLNLGADNEYDFGLYYSWGDTVGYPSIADRQFDHNDYVWNDTTLHKNLWYGYYKYQVADGYDGTDKTHPQAIWYDDEKKFIGDNKTQLDLADDAATHVWGNGWRMPTKEEVKELCENCISEWDIVNGTIGKRMTSKINGKSIFFPTAGDWGHGLIHWVGEQGYYWTSTLKYSADETDGKYENNECPGAGTLYAFMLYFSAENKQYETKQHEDTPCHLHYARRFGGRSIRPVHD